MKKIGVALAIIILLSSLSIAQIIEPNEKETNYSYRITSIQEKTNQIIDKPIEMPDFLQIPIKIIFGVGEKSSFQLVIISIMLWFLFFLLFSNIIKLFSPFSEAVTITSGAVFSIILASIGFIKGLSLWLINVGDNIKFIEKWGILQLMMIAIIIIAIWIVSKVVTKSIKDSKEIEKAHEAGIKAGASLGFMNSLKKVFYKMGGSGDTMHDK